MESATIDLPEVIIEAEAATQNVLCCRDILLRPPLLPRCYSDIYLDADTAAEPRSALVAFKRS